MPMILVADVSHWQPPSVPWGDLYIDGVRGMFAQVTHGDQLDIGAFKHVQYAASAGVLTGLYHWLTPATTPGTDPENQARLFAAQISPSWRGRLAVDIEEDGVTPQVVDKFLSLLDSLAKSWPIIIYTRKDWWEKNIGAYQSFRWPRFDLWAAGGPGYDQAETAPPPGYAAPIPSPWKSAALEQFTGHGQLTGYPGDLDLSLYRKTEAEFIDWWTLAGGVKTVPTYTDAQVQQMSDAAATILGILKPGIVPPTPLPLHSMATMTNQAVINIFSTTFGGLGTLEAQLDPPQTIVLYTARLAFYTGPAIEQMPSLTDAQRASIIAALPVPQAAG